MKKAYRAGAVAAVLMMGAFSVAPQASAHGARDMLWRITNDASVRQDGAGDRAATTQSGAANGSAIEQNGGNLIASVSQNGDANTAAIRQFGHNSTGSITQNGSGNEACLIQVGRNVSGEIVQNGDNQSSGLLQTRHRSMPIPVQMCQSYDHHHGIGLIRHVALRSILEKRR